MVEGEAIGSRNIVVSEPGSAIAIRSRDEQPVQGGREHGALDGKLEGAVLEHLSQNIGDTALLPQPAKQQRSADALGGHGESAVFVLIAGIEEHDLMAELGARGEQEANAEFISASARPRLAITDWRTTPPARWFSTTCR